MQPILPFACDYQERELTTWLEDTASHNNGIQQALVERYYLGVYSLAWGILSDYKTDSIRDEDIQVVLRRTFSLAFEGLHGFQGQESVRSWLFRLTIQAARAIKHKPEFLRHIRLRGCLSHQVSQMVSPRTRDVSQEKLWENVQTLNQNLRIIAFLRYAHRFTLPEIAYTLKRDVSQIHACLIDIREKLLDRQFREDEAAKPHGEFRSAIHAFLDGALDTAIYQGELTMKSKLAIHLDNCPACKNIYNRLSDLEMKLAGGLPLCCPLTDLKPDTVQGYLIPKRSGFGLSKPNEASLIRRSSNGREIIWLSSVIIMVIVISWYLVRQDTLSGKPLFPATPYPPPTPILASETMIRTAPYLSRMPGGSVESTTILAPVLSADGHNVAFELITNKLVDGLLQTTSQVKIYNQTTGKIELISVSLDGAPENGSSLNPSISADGRWISFSSNSSNLVEGDHRTCLWGNEETSCFDIFIRDSLTGETKRISISPEGDEADGHSVLSALSSNGRWVAFWSFATNLTSRDEISCRTTDSKQACWDVYLRDLQSGQTIRIPIGRPRISSEWPASDLLSISDDGRWLTLTLQSGDNVNSKLSLSNNRDVFLYNREFETFEALNLSTDGMPGNGDSYNASLTKDGRFVVFTSEASNLVKGDHNQVADVFIRDRLKISTERISVSSDGREGNHPSGVFPDVARHWGTRNTLSTDGRLVTFFSTADNLGQEKVTPCHTGGWFQCSRIYVRDRQCNITKAVVQGKQLNAFYEYPSISSDGRWISMVHLDLECPRKPICSVLMLQDQQTSQFSQFIDPIQIGSLTDSQPFENPVYLEIPGSRVNHLDFSPNGELLAAGGDDGSINVWNISENSLVYRLEDHNLPVSSVAFSPDGKLLATGSFDGKVIIYRATDGTCLYYLTGTGKSIASLAFSPNGNILSVGASSAAWNLEANERSFSTLDYYEYADVQVNQIAFSPDGHLTAHALSDNTVWLRRVSDGEIVARLSGSRSKVHSVTFSPDGNYLASGSADGRVNLWRIESGDGKKYSLNNALTLLHTSWIGDLDFSPDGKILAVASLGNSVCLWHIPSGELLTSFLVTTWDPALSLAFSPNGDSLAVSLSWGGVKIWPFPQLH